MTTLTKKVSTVNGKTVIEQLDLLNVKLDLMNRNDESKVITFNKIINNVLHYSFKDAGEIIECKASHSIVAANVDEFTTYELENIPVPVKLIEILNLTAFKKFQSNLI